MITSSYICSYKMSETSYEMTVLVNVHYNIIPNDRDQVPNELEQLPNEKDQLQALSWTSHRINGTDYLLRGTSSELP